MNPITPSSSLSLYQTQSGQSLSPTAPETPPQKALLVEQGRVTLSDEGKALLAALQQIEKESDHIDQGQKSVTDKVNSFTHGALGMDHPDDVQETQDDSYSAGQYVSGALTVGGILLALL